MRAPNDVSLAATIGREAALRLLLDLPADAGPFRAEVTTPDGRRVEVRFLPAGSVDPLAGLSDLERAILDTVRDSPKRLTRPRLRDELAGKGRRVNDSHLGDVLSRLVALDVLSNDHDRRGYYVGGGTVADARTQNKKAGIS